MWVRALVAVQRLATGSAGVSPAELLESMPLSFFIHAGETPALPVANRWTASLARTSGLKAGPTCFRN
jgi:hypothetical protein